MPMMVGKICGEKEKVGVVIVCGMMRYLCNSAVYTMKSFIFSLKLILL